jgi:hypothetical protein
MRSAFGVDHGDEQVYKSLSLAIAALPAEYVRLGIRGLKALRHAPAAAKRAARPHAVKLAEYEARGQRVGTLNAAKRAAGEPQYEQSSRPDFGRKRIAAYDRGYRRTYGQ